MKIEPENTFRPAACKGVDGDHSQPASTLLQDLGITFVEAGALLLGNTEDVVDIAEAIHITAPQTAADAMIKLRTLSGELGISGGSSPSHSISASQLFAFFSERIRNFN